MSQKKFFGTDGIRGPAGIGKMSPGSLFGMAQAIGAFAGTGRMAVIGRDTRASGDAIAATIAAGLASTGVNVVDLGVLPTPATALMTQSLGADLGVMITASHNPWQDNGVKLFSGKGTKLSPDAEAEIERRIAEADYGETAYASIANNNSGLDEYVKALSDSVGRGQPLSSLKVALDAANGAAHAVLPRILKALGATITAQIGVEPDGQNINRGVGSTHTEALQAAVVKTGADVGVALDGDADRLILVDETGAEVDGDQIMATLAEAWHRSGQLKGGGLVSTVMSNLGLEKHLESLGLTLARTKVGDKYVAAHMRDHGFNLGGEPSGHLLMTDFAPTGDGTLAAVQLLAHLARSDAPASAVLNRFAPYPQLLENVRYSGTSPMEAEAVKAAIQAADESLGADGRVLVRASGTEPVIRVMAEGLDAGAIRAAVDQMKAAIQAAAGS